MRITKRIAAEGGVKAGLIELENKLDDLTFKRGTETSWVTITGLGKDIKAAEAEIKAYKKRHGITDTKAKSIKDFSVYKDANGNWTKEGVESITQEQFADSLVIDNLSGGGGYKCVLGHTFDGDWVYNEYASLGSLLKNLTDGYLIDYCTPEGKNAYVKKYDDVEYEEGCVFGKVTEKFHKHIKPFDPYGTWALWAHGAINEKHVIAVAFEMWRRRMLMVIKLRERNETPKYNQAHFDAYCTRG